MKRIQRSHQITSYKATPWLGCAESSESLLERTLTWFEVLGYTVLLQSDIISGRHQAILQSYCNGIVGDRFRSAMQRINPTVSMQHIESILYDLRIDRSMPMLQQNRRWHLQVLNGIHLESIESNPSISPSLNLIDFTDLLNNDWLVISSFPVVEGSYQRCLDLVVFVNGLPLAVFHGLHAGNDSWSLRATYLQLQEANILLPKFFSFNELLVLCNGLQSRIGTLTSQWKQFVPIRSTDGTARPLRGTTEMEILIQGIFDKRRLFEIIRHSIAFHQSRTKLTKRFRPHSFCTINASKL